MTHAVDASLLVSFASALLYTALGIWVLTLTPRRTATLLLGAFAVFFGLEFGLQDLTAILDLEDVVLLGQSVPHPVWHVGYLLRPVNALAILGLAAFVPRRLEDQRLLAAAVAIAGGFAAVWVGSELAGRWPLGFWDYYAELTVGVAAVGHWGASALIALRASPSRDPTVDEATQLAILGVAWAFFWVYISGGTLMGAARPDGAGLLAGSLGNIAIGGAWLAVAALWGRNMLRAGPETVRVHRTAMLATLGLLLAGAVSAVAMSPDVRGRLAGGIARTIGIGLLVYGVLRHDLAGLDAKVEWTVSKTTVAGIFVAVFFVAGELAETFFGEVLGPYVGVIAAGLLVFAISPIQRMADRFAAKAVPGGAQAGAGVEAQYRAAVEMALVDGEIDREEERRLAEKADELGIGATRALELREQVEDERRPRGDDA